MADRALDALRAAIIASPEDEALRRAMAERLIADGDARGELIVLQLALRRRGLNPARRGQLRRREAALRRAVAEREGWTLDALRLAGGFVEEVAVDGAALGSVRSLLAREPVRALRLRSADDRAMASLVACPAWGRLRSLRISGELGPAGVKALASSPGLEAVERLHLAGCSLEGADLAALVGSAHLRARVLTLTKAPLGDAGAEALAAGAPAWRERCRELYLARCEIGDRGAAALLAPGAFSRLDLLGLDGNDLGDAGVAAVEAALATGALRSVELTGTGISYRERARLRERWGERVEG